MAGMKKLKVGSLFSGIGGFDLGLEQVGMDVIWQCEIDKACQSVLKQHFPKAELYDDVKQITKSSARGAVDVLVGGFPCQDLSVAGKRAGLAGERSGLWWEFARVIDELRPRWVVIENVPGLLSSDGGKDMAIIVSKLAELGYLGAYRILDSQYFGVAQRRRRVFIVGCLGNPTAAAKVLFEQESGDWNFAPSREKGTRTSALSAGGSGSGRSPDDNTSQGNKLVALDALNQSVSEQAPTLRSERADGEHQGYVAFQQNERDEVRMIGGDGDIVGALQAEPGIKQQNYLATHVVPPLTATGVGAERTGNERNEADFVIIEPPLVGALQERDSKGIGTTIDDKLVVFNSRQDPIESEDVSLPLGEQDKGHAVVQKPYTIQTNDGGKHKRKDRPEGGMYVQEADKALAVGSTDLTAVAFGHSGGETLKLNEKANTLNSQTGSETTHMIQGALTRSGVRRLTPVECERLQGFPDSWTAIITERVAKMSKAELDYYRFHLERAYGREFSDAEVRQVTADSVRYRQLGNAVTVNVIRWIGSRIMEIEGLTENPK